jgi:DNA-binding response OmpR family regulator
MNIKPLFTVVVLMLVGFAISAGALRQRGFAIDYASTGGSRLHEIGRRDVYLLCLDHLLPCGKHSLRWRFIIQ